MKIVTKCEISWDTLEVTNEESYEYEGPVVECKGGGSAGEVDYPDYMKAVHEDWLTQSGTDSIEDSITSKMNTALGSSPWATKTAYNPDTTLATANASVAVFAAMLADVTDCSLLSTIYDAVTGKFTPIVSISDISETAMLAETTSYSDLIDDVKDGSLLSDVYDDISAKLTAVTSATEITEAVLLAETAAYSDLLDDEIETKTLPAFRAGMQDVNLVTSSAFVVGEALIYAFKNRDLAKYTADIRLNAANKNADIRLSNNQSIVAMNQVKSNLTDSVLKLVLSGSDSLMKSKIGVRLDVASRNVDVKVANNQGIISTNQLKSSLSDDVLKLSLTGNDTLMKTTAELSRISIVAKKEQNDLNNEIAAKDAVWDLEVFQYGGNLLAAISGSSMATQKPSTVSSVIGGAMSGAAAGGSIGGPWGAAIGGGIGAIAGIFG